MPSKMTAKQVRTLMKAEAAKAGQGEIGACMVMRFQPGTHVTCQEMTKAACDLVDRKLGDSGHARFLGTGTRCL